MPKSWFLRNFKKFLLPAVGTVVVAGATTYIQSRISDRSPNIVVRQYLNTVESKKPVPGQVGGLKLEYRTPAEGVRAIYLIEVANEGRGTEKDLRLQARFPYGMNPAFEQTPDLKIYKPGTVSLESDGFFMELGGFPKKARAEIAFLSPEEEKLLCAVEIKVAGENGEGRVEEIRGVSCD